MDKADKVSANVGVARAGGLLPARLEKWLAALAEKPGMEPSFEVRINGGRTYHIGSGEPAFRLVLQNERAVSALASFDELPICEAYLDGDLDIEGDLLSAFRLRGEFTDKHPLLYLWSTYGRRLIYGQVACDEKWVSEHYDNEPDFYLLFLDKQARCYSHGYFEGEGETLEAAIQRKLGTAFEVCGLRPGQRVLDIGGGWGAFTEYGGTRGVQVTSLTISVESERYIKDLIAREGLPCSVVREHFLEYKADEPFDAIVNLGVTEHLPDYASTLAQYQRLLKPGGRVFLDACASRTKFPFSSFTMSYAFPGNASPLQLSDYMRELEKTPFELVYLKNDRNSYRLTTKHWAENLDRGHDEIAARWGERLFRRFHLYLWSCVNAFEIDDITAYRLALELPRDAGTRGGLQASVNGSGPLKFVKKLLRG
jgi:cyclopropane-fatty-acyl-phospholipid synthase